MVYSTENLERFRWPISVSTKIKASPTSVWAAISTAGNLGDCHPFCKKNPVTEWVGKGSRDTIYYYSGWVLHREFVNWFEGIGYDLTIGREGGRKSYVSWRITREQENISRLNITLYPHTLQNIPVVFRWLPHIVIIRPAMKEYLESVVKGFEWFITTGKPVKKNQFGSHKWFSKDTN